MCMCVYIYIYICCKGAGQDGRTVGKIFIWSCTGRARQCHWVRKSGTAPYCGNV